MEKDNTIFQRPGFQSARDVPVTQIPSEDFLSSPQGLSSQVFSGITSPQPLQAQQEVPPGTSDEQPKVSGMSKFKKFLSIFSGIIIVVGLIVIVATFMIPAFNKNPSSDKVTITYWGVFENNSVMQNAIADFEKQNPNINVEYIKQDINQYKDRLETRIANGTGPDIFRFHNTWYPMLKNYLLPLPTQTMTQDEFKSIFYPVMQKDLIRNGAIYGIPLEIDTLSLFINTGLFQSAGIAPPTNWNDFLNDARAITVKDSDGKIKTAGAAMGTYANITHAPDIMSLLFLQNSVDMNNFSTSSDRITGALTFYTSFASTYVSVWDNTLDPSQLAFAKGNLGMFFGYSTDYFAIKQFNPNLSFQIVPVPQLADQNVSLASYWVGGVSIKSKHQKEALLFIKYLSKKETEQKIYEEESKVRDFGEPFARVDLADNLKTNPLVYPFVLQAPNALSSPFVDGTYDNGLNQQLNTYLENVINVHLPNPMDQKPVDDFVKNVLKTFQQYGQ